MNFRNFVMAALTVAAFAGCEKNFEGVDSEGNESVELSVRISGTQTKSEGTQNENNVKTVQIFVFDHNKMLEAYTAGDGSQGVYSISCSTGQKEVVALVNAKPLTDVKSMTDLEGRKTLLQLGGGQAAQILEGIELQPQQQGFFRPQIQQFTAAGVECVLEIGKISPEGLLFPAVPFFLIVIADDFHGIQFSTGILSVNNPKAASIIPMHMNGTCVIHFLNSSLCATWNISVWVVHGNQFNP